MIEIIPAILAKTTEEFEFLVRRLEPYTNRVHLDVADGIFVPNKTIDGYKELMDINTSLKFDVHLMVQKASDHLDEWLNTPAERYFVHAETDHDLKDCISQMRNHDKEVGIVLNPDTDISLAEPFLGIINYIQFMTVHPGFYGGKFVDEVVDKISKFHVAHPDIPILVDGGITSETAASVISAGANILVSGSYIIKSQDIRQAIEGLKAGIK